MSVRVTVSGRWVIMEAASTSETSVNFHQITLRSNPKDSHVHSRRRISLYWVKVIFKNLINTGPFYFSPLFIQCIRWNYALCWLLKWGLVIITSNLLGFKRNRNHTAPTSPAMLCLERPQHSSVGEVADKHGGSAFPRISQANRWWVMLRIQKNKTLYFIIEFHAHFYTTSKPSISCERKYLWASFNQPSVHTYDVYFHASYLYYFLSIFFILSYFCLLV
jgi:hypothetical protein